MSPAPISQPRVLRLGLTGGIGSGKSTVAALLAKHGAAVIDADAISRALTAPGGLAMDAIARSFGASFVNTAGALERQRMRDLVFQDPDAKQRLEAIIHPLVSQETQRSAQQALDAGAQCLVFDVPLLVESRHWRSRVDLVVVVDCLEATQVQRTVARSGLTPASVEAIITSQASRAQRLQAADVVLYNDSISLAQLEQEVWILASGFGLSLAHPTDTI